MAVTTQTRAKPQSGLSVLDQQIMQRPPRSLWSDAWRRLKKNSAAMVGLVVVILFLLIAIFAPFLSPHNPVEFFPNNTYRPPFWVQDGVNPAAGGNSSFPLGTDSLGADVFSRTLYGARVSMVVGFIPMLIILILGLIIGVAAGYGSSRVDNLLMRFTDVVYAFPDLLFFIIVMVALRDSWIGTLLNGLVLLFVALAIVSWVGLARLVRGQVLSLKEKEFVEAARMVGAGNARIMFRHLLPNSLGPIIVFTAFRIPNLIITEAILGYLGLGLRPSTNPQDIFITSWGALLLEGQTAINSQPWILVAPAICVSAIVLAFNFLGDGLRDALDPRSK
ncbi:MAG: ABC transporter permease [Chloroflexi bacterium]|nr:ABC transporter permease [Chloroflexota bacterium]